MKNKICLITVSKITNNVLKKQLTEIFGSKYEITGLLSNNFNGIDFENCKLIVSTDTNIINENIPVIMAKRSIGLENLLEVLSIEPNTDVMVVSNFIDEANKIIKELRNFGVNHINMTPYCPGIGMKVKKTAILVGEDLKQDNVENSIYIGERYIDISTILEIFLNLDMEISDIELLEKNYNKRISEFSKYNFNVNSVLRNIMNVIHEGVAFVNMDDKIVACNSIFSSLLEQNHNALINENYKNIIKNKSVLTLIENQNEIINEIINYNNKQLVLNKKWLYENNKILGFLISVQDVTHIFNMENMVRRKLKSRGYIAKYTFSDIIGDSNSIKESIKKAKKMSKNDFTILITGENGTGKEVFAQAIHNSSARKNGPFVAVNLASLPDDLAISELFGYEEGAFTGASKGGKEGLFLSANKGTIFLDEIGDASLLLQKRLLRVIQEREVMPLGSQKILPIDVRIIAATNKNLQNMISSKEFRNDLYYRLDVLNISLPNLYERKKDISILTKYFMDKAKSHKTISTNALDSMKTYRWPGNIRELENVVNYIICISENNVIDINDLPDKFNRTENSNSFNIIFTDLENKQILDNCLFILEMFKMSKDNKQILGRNKLLKIMNENDFSITIDKLRNRLTTLNNYNLIISGTTKQGSSLTYKGELFLNYCKEKI